MTATCERGSKLFAANALYTATLSNLTGFKQSPGVTVAVGGITPSSFTAQSSLSSGNKTFNWDSGNGGLQNAP